MKYRIPYKVQYLFPPKMEVEGKRAKQRRKIPKYFKQLLFLPTFIGGMTLISFSGYSHHHVSHMYMYIYWAERMLILRCWSWLQNFTLPKLYTLQRPWFLMILQFVGCVFQLIRRLKRIKVHWSSRCVTEKQKQTNIFLMSDVDKKLTLTQLWQLGQN